MLFLCSPLSVGSRRKFLHSSRCPQTSVTNNIIVVSLEISFQLWHDLWLGYRTVLIIGELLESFGLLLLFFFLFFVEARYLSI